MRSEFARLSFNDYDVLPMTDAHFMRLALRLARRGYGNTSPNPMVGAVLVKGGKIVGRGWHRQAGKPHAEIEALNDARKHGNAPSGATLFVTLEPCCTHGRTPPCVEAILAAKIKRVVVGAIDPNPKHAGNGFRILKRAGIEVLSLADKKNSRDGELSKIGRECVQLNEAFDHWIVHRTPFVTVKAAMTLDGKIATANGESKWVTGEKSRALGMKLREGSDAILVGVNTILADDPALTVRRNGKLSGKKLRRIVLDTMARTPLTAKVVTDECASLTTIVVGGEAPASRVAALARRVNVWTAPDFKTKSDSRCSYRRLRWLLKKLGRENVTSLLVEGGGEVNASFLLNGLARHVAFFYAPKILGGRDARKAVAGDGVLRLKDAVQLEDVEWRKVGTDLLLNARIKHP